MKKTDLLKSPVEHIDFTSFDATPVIDSMRKMSFSSRATAKAADIYSKMIEDEKCTIILTLSGSTSAAGCMNLYSDLIKFGMVDVVVATGASIVDMDFFEALGFRHYQGTPFIDDKELRKLYIDRIYDTYINEEELQQCDATIKEIADNMVPGVYSSREFIHQMGSYLEKHAKKTGSLVQLAYQRGVPVFCPAFSDSSAGFGLVHHQWDKPNGHLSIDSVKDFLELTRIKMNADNTGLVIIGGGVPKNFAQDTVVCTEILGEPAPVHKYAIQVTVADERDGALSGSTLKEASSWGKVDTIFEEMVYAEATTVLPLIASYLYHKGIWQGRGARNWNRLFSEK